jgi:hypothetical protein
VVDLALDRRRWQAPWYRWYLRVCNTTTYTVTDDELLGETDFNAVEYDSDRRQVRILANAPVRIDVAVRDLHVIVEQPRSFSAWPLTRRGREGLL